MLLCCRGTMFRSHLNRSEYGTEVKLQSTVLSGEPVVNFHPPPTRSQKCGLSHDGKKGTLHSVSATCFTFHISQRKRVSGNCVCATHAKHIRGAQQRLVSEQHLPTAQFASFWHCTVALGSVRASVQTAPCKAHVPWGMGSQHVESHSPALFSSQ